MTTRKVTLQSLTGTTPILEGVTAPSEITVAPSETTGTTLSLQVASRPRIHSGWREGQVKIRLRGFQRREVTLPFKAMVEGIVDTEPSFLNFGTVVPGQIKILTMQVIKRTDQPVRLNLISKPSFLLVMPLSDKRTLWKVKLKAPSNIKPKQVLSGKIIFKTNLSIQPVLKVPFFAAVE